MEDSHTLAGVHKFCIDLSHAKLAKVGASIKASRSKHVHKVIVKVEIGKYIGPLCLSQIFQAIALPYLNLKDAKNTVFLLFLNCL